jgi:hypothetical protein
VERRYKLQRGIAFVVHYPTVREIFAATFRDRVIHHLVYNYINLWWEPRFINDSYSCRVDKGTHFGMRRIARFLRAVTDNYQREAWVMKLDIYGYFMHMRRDILWKQVQEGLQGQFPQSRWQERWPRQDEMPAPTWGEVRQMLEYVLPIIIFADPTRNILIKGKLQEWNDLPRSKSLFWARPKSGFPIGNLTSQLFANIYLNRLDNWVKRHLRMKYYGRYVDDIVLMHRDKSVLLRVRSEIEQFLRQEMSLQLHPWKFYLQPARCGVDFVGGRIRPQRILPGKRIRGNYRQLMWGQREWTEAQRASMLGAMRWFK